MKMNELRQKTEELEEKLRKQGTRQEEK